MAKEQGSLPPEGVIKLESLKEQWLLFEKGILTSFSSFGLIKDGGRTLKIDIEVKTVVSPSRHKSRDVLLGFSGMLDAVTASGVIRANQFFLDMVNEKTWLIFGNIKGENKIPITIIYYEVFDLAIYAQKLIGEELKSFLPSGNLGTFSNN